MESSSGWAWSFCYAEQVQINPGVFSAKPFILPEPCINRSKLFFVGCVVQSLVLN